MKKCATRLARKTCKQRLRELGLTDMLFETYLHMFSSNRLEFKYIYRPKDSDNWITSKYRWTKNLVARHLTREDTIGLFPADFIDFMMFDIDNHESQQMSVHERTTIIRDLFPTEPLVYQSSISGGIRVLYFLDELCPSEVVKEFATDNLKKVGLSHRSGYVEIKADRSGDRLPFGDGSYLLDWHTLEPLYSLTLSETIKYFKEIYDGDKLHIPRKDWKMWEVTGNEKVSVVNRLIEEGLWDEITTNEAFQKLTYHLLAIKRQSPAEAKRWLKAWIRNNHNGFSDRANSGKLDELDSQIDRWIDGFDLSKLKSPPSVKRLSIGLPESTCNFILGNFDRESDRLGDIFKSCG